MFKKHCLLIVAIQTLFMMSVCSEDQIFQVAGKRKHFYTNNTFLLRNKGYNGITKKWIVSSFKD